MIGPIDGHDVDAVDARDRQARQRSDRQPTLIVCKTTIGKGAPNRAGTAKAHGEALGADEIELTREALGWAHEPFVVPEAAYAHWDAQGRAARAAEAAWDERFAAYARRASRAGRRVHCAAWRGELPTDFDAGRGRRGGRARTPRPRPWPRARPASSRSRPSPQALPELLGGTPT